MTLDSDDADGDDGDVTDYLSPTGSHVAVRESSGTAEIACAHCGHDKFVFRPKRTADGGDEDFSPRKQDGYDPNYEADEAGRVTATYSPVQSFLSALADQEPRGR